MLVVVVECSGGGDGLVGLGDSRGLSLSLSRSSSSFSKFSLDEDLSIIPPS